MTESWTILHLISWCREYFTGKGIGTPRLDAEVLLAHVLGVDRVGLYLRFEQELSPDELARFRELVRRRGQREPLAYIVGTKEFYGLSFKVDKRVLVPRPETELLVDTILEKGPADQPWRICDVGTGSGCVALALAARRPNWSFVATDNSAAALEVARENAVQLKASDRVRFVRCHLLDGLAGAFDAVISNPPYLPSADCAAAMPEVSAHEPRTSLDGGTDGLDFIRVLVNRAPEVLNHGGWLALEVSLGQADAVRELIDGNGRYNAAEALNDLAGIPRVVAAQLKTPSRA